MPTKKVRFRCEQCLSRRIIDQKKSIKAVYSDWSPWTINLCPKCYDEVSKSRVWTPRWDKRKIFNVIEL